MAALAPGSTAPPVSGLARPDGVRALFFYKVNCPVCQLAAPVTERFEQGYPGRIAGVGQDPEGHLADFSHEFGVSFPSVSDPPLYEASDAYGIRVVPTLFLIDGDGTILDTVESWDRDGYNRVSRRLAALTGSEYVPISEAGDGLPAFRPG